MEKVEMLPPTSVRIDVELLKFVATADTINDVPALGADCLDLDDGRVELDILRD